MDRLESSLLPIQHKSRQRYRPTLHLKANSGTNHPSTRRSVGLASEATLHKSLLTTECSHLIVTVTPWVTAFSTWIASQFASRMQPWLAERPIESGLFVP